MTLFEQLNAGIRYLDIRCKVVDGALRIYHGIVPANLTFNSDVRDVFMGFLDLNPSECIVMLVSNGSGQWHQEFEGLFRDSIQAHPEKWYLGNTVPELGDARGKIILVRRFPVACPAEPFGIDGTVWLDNQTFEISNTAKFSIQDQYVVPTFADINHKWEHIEELLEKTAGGTGGRWFIN
jgi:1-phosphatidylinositol phosphodiesterase